jgi:predicted dehydrogenase
MRTAVAVGVVGLGASGLELARVFADLPGAELRWISDTSSEALLRARPQAGTARPSSSYDELLADDALDAIVVATPQGARYEVARRALEAGKHVLVLPPLALTGVDADDLVERAERRGLRLMAGHVLLFHPGVRRLKDLLDRGEAGDVYYLSGRRVGPQPAAHGVNVLWELGPHDVATVLHLLGDQPVDVRAVGDAYVQPGAADVVAASLSFATGIRVHLLLSRLEAFRTRQLIVVGSRRTIVLDEDDAQRTLCVHDGDPEGEVVSPRLPPEEPLRAECEHFLAAVRSSARLPFGPREGAAVVNVLEALQRSLERGGKRQPVGSGELLPGVVRLPSRRG